MSQCKSCGRHFNTRNPDGHCFDCAGYADSEWNAEAFRLLAAKDALARRIPKPSVGYTVVLPGGAFPYTFKDKIDLSRYQVFTDRAAPGGDRSVSVLARRREDGSIDILSIKETP